MVRTTLPTEVRRGDYIIVSSPTLAGIYHTDVECHRRRMSTDISESDDDDLQIVPAFIQTVFNAEYPAYH